MPTPTPTDDAPTARPAHPPIRPDRARRSPTTRPRGLPRAAALLLLATAALATAARPSPAATVTLGVWNFDQPTLTVARPTTPPPGRALPTLTTAIPFSTQAGGYSFSSFSGPGGGLAANAEPADATTATDGGLIVYTGTNGSNNAVPFTVTADLTGYRNATLKFATIATASSFKNVVAGYSASNAPNSLAGATALSPGLSTKTASVYTLTNPATLNDAARAYLSFAFTGASSSAQGGDFVRVDNIVLRADAIGAATSVSAAPTSIDLGRVLRGSATPTASVALNFTGNDDKRVRATATGGAVLTSPFAAPLASIDRSFGPTASAGSVGVGVDTAGPARRVAGTVVVANRAVASDGAGLGSADPDDRVTVAADLLDAPTPELSGATLARDSAGGSAYTLDLGTMTAGDGGATATFSVANLPADADAPNRTTRLDLDAVAPLDSAGDAGDPARLSAGLSPFADLAAGNALAFTATLLDGEAGTFRRTYRLTFTPDDAATGSGESQFARALTLTLLGEVVAATPVPEPLSATAGLTLLGVAVLPRGRRHAGD